MIDTLKEDILRNFGFNDFLIKKYIKLCEKYKEMCILLLKFEVHDIPSGYYKKYNNSYCELSNFMTENGIPKLKKGKL